MNQRYILAAWDQTFFLHSPFCNLARKASTCFSFEMFAVLILLSAEEQTIKMRFSFHCGPLRPIETDGKQTELGTAWPQRHITALAASKLAWQAMALPQLLTSSDLDTHCAPVYPDHQAAAAC